MSKFVIGIDQSYTDTGITVLCDKKLVHMWSVKCEKDCTHTQYRKHFSKIFDGVLSEVFKHSIKEDDKRDVKVIVERISLREKKGGLSQAYVKGAASLISVIIDVAEKYSVPVYSVDTRSWKSQIVGTSKPLKNRYGIPGEKYPTILYLKRRGLLKHICEVYEGRGKKGVIEVYDSLLGYRKKCKINDNLADSYCIAEYGYLPAEKQKLQLERF